MSKKSKIQRVRALRIFGVVVLVAALFWLAVNLSGYSQKGEPSLLKDLPLLKLPPKLQEVLGEARKFEPLQEENQEKTQSPKLEILSLSEIKETTQEKVVEGSKEVVREKVVEILKELINKLTETEETKEKVCDQVCEEVCREVCE